MTNKDSTKNIVLWNLKTKKTIKSLGEMALGYKWMHARSSQQYNKTYNILMYISIAIGPIAGILTGINSILKNTLVLPIIIAVISFLSSVFIAVIKFGNFEEKCNSHREASGKYTSLANNARIQLSLDDSKKENPDDYLSYYTKSYSDLYESCPLILNNIKEEYKIFAKSINRIVPDEVGIVFDTSEFDEENEEIENLKKTPLCLNIKQIKKYNQDEENLYKKYACTIDSQGNEICLPLDDDNHNFELKTFDIGGITNRDYKKTELVKYSIKAMKQEISKNKNNI